MTKSIQIIGILAILPLFTMGLATNFLIQSVEAYVDPAAGRNLDRDMVCRSGQVLVYHFNNRAYTCTSAGGAATWAQYGIAEIVKVDGERIEPTTERVDRGEFAKRSEEKMRISEIETIKQKVEDGERLSTGEQRTLKRSYEKELSMQIIEEREARPDVATGTTSMLQNVPKQQTSSQTLTSVTDAGMGHGDHQLAIILPPSENVYIGRLSFSASEPVQYVMLLGPLGPGEDKGQPIWSPDGETKYSLVIVDDGLKSGGYFFAGNALALHTMNPTPFTATVSVVYTEVAPGVYPRGTVTAGTIDSMPDPGVGHEGHSLAIILPPRDIPNSHVVFIWD